PDVLTAVFGFSTAAGSSAAALSQNNAKVAQALAALTDNGVAARDTQTTGLNLSPQYSYPHGVATLTGYQATETITATMRNPSTEGAAIDAVVNASGNAAQVDALTFSFANPSAVQDKARTAAVHQAVAHAHAMAAAAGRSLGPVCSITDNTQPTNPLSNEGFQAALPAAGATSVPLAPGTQVESDQVTMVYALQR
ncbi:MAG: SIMPL domain-containing protein, partial [Acidimicrobiales bacterium]